MVDDGTVDVGRVGSVVPLRVDGSMNRRMISMTMVHVTRHCYHYTT